jgi:bifunctional DNA-binding transcriptional regulator/antitoxin component of YhaV-PrlF toxin-antitoxin module
VGLALAGAACDIKVGEGGGLSVDFAAGKASDEWVRTYDIKPGGRLDIINVDGQIHASPASGSQVEIRAIREVRSGSEEASRELLQKSEMREDVTPDHVTVETPHSEERGREFRRPRLTVRYDVRVPAGLNMLLKTQNGEVRL